MNDEQVVYSKLIEYTIREFLIKISSFVMEEKNKDIRRTEINPEWFPVGEKLLKPKDTVREVLRDTTLFRGIRSRDWRELTSFFHERHYLAGETIFHQGTPGLGMYIIVEGLVQIIKFESDVEIEYARLGPKEIFGELALIDAQERAASAIATTPTKLIGIFRPQLENMMRRRPKLGVLIFHRLAEIVSYRLRETNRLLAECRSKLATSGK